MSLLGFEESSHLPMCAPGRSKDFHCPVSSSGRGFPSPPVWHARIAYNPRSSDLLWPTPETLNGHESMRWCIAVVTRMFCLESYQPPKTRVTLFSSVSNDVRSSVDSIPRFLSLHPLEIAIRLPIRRPSLLLPKRRVSNLGRCLLVVTARCSPETPFEP